MSGIEGEGKKETQSKQKGGLNAVRLNDHIENNFKQMAAERHMTQTQMFLQMYWEYVNNCKEEQRRQAVDLSNEINSIAESIGSIMQQFERMAAKAQDTAISYKNNAEQTERNLRVNIDTLQKKVEELGSRNDELEKSNEAFGKVKAGMQKEIQELAEEKRKLAAELGELKEANKQADAEVKRLEKQAVKDEKEVERLSKELDERKERIRILEENLKEKSDELKDGDRRVKELDREAGALKTENANLVTTVGTLQGELRSKESTVGSLESSNRSLGDTLRNMEELKKAELSAIDAKYQMKLEELQTQVDAFGREKLRLQEERQKEVYVLRQSLLLEHEADKKLAVAELKLEMAAMTTKYSEGLMQKEDRLSPNPKKDTKNGE